MHFHIFCESGLFLLEWDHGLFSNTLEAVPDLTLWNFPLSLALGVLPFNHETVLKSIG
jgi:hypothetical protein